MSTPILLKALEIATEAHKGQKRWKGEEYITHPIKVADIAVNQIYPLFNIHITGITAEYDKMVLYIVAIWHDLEDTIYNLKEENAIAQLKECYNNLYGNTDGWAGFGSILNNYLKIVNKNSHKSYRDYIVACKSYQMTRMVKIADITHNLSDLTKGSMKDKYELALHILNN